MLPKNELFCTKKNLMFEKLVIVLLLLMLPFSESVAYKCSKKKKVNKVSKFQASRLERERASA